MFLFLCHPPITRQAACGRSRRTSSSSGSSARRAGLEEARLVNLARQSPDSHMPCCWRGGARASSGPICAAAARVPANLERCRCGQKVYLYSVSVTIFFLFPVANVSNNHTNPPGKTSSSNRDWLVSSLLCVSAVFPCVVMFDRCSWCT